MPEEKPSLPVELEEEIESCLVQPWHDLPFPPKLEQRFQTGTSSSQRWRLRFGLFLFAVAHLVMLLADFQGDHAQAIRSLAIRAGLILPVCVLAATFLFRDIPEWGQGIVAGLPIIIAMLADSWLALRATPRYADTYCIALLLETFVANLILPLRVKSAALVNITCVSIYLGLLYDAIGTAPAVQNRGMDGCLVFLGLVSFGIRWHGEVRDRHTYLVSERDRLHAQQLAWANRQLRELSYTDPLTGLPNRRFFSETLCRTWEAACAANQPISLLVIDVDRFKRFNDALGHAAGDKCLRRIARTLQFSVRVEMDTLVRYGGEEFVAILPKASLADALRVGERVRLAVAELQLLHPANPDGPYVTVSIGAASCLNANQLAQPEALFQSADTALYNAKSRGRNCVSGGVLVPANPSQLLSAPPSAPSLTLQ